MVSAADALALRSRAKALQDQAAALERQADALRRECDDLVIAAAAAAEEAAARTSAPAEAVIRRARLLEGMARLDKKYGGRIGKSHTGSLAAPVTETGR